MTGKAIAIVDDDEAVQDSLRAVLETNGYVVSTFSSGREFLDSLTDKPVSCLILDINLAEMSVWEIMDRLRQDRCMPPTIIVTGHGNAHSRRLAERSGVRSFVEKPLDVGTLLELVDQVFDTT